MRLLLDIGIACLAVFGFYFLICTVLGFLDSDDRTWIAVTVKDRKDADMLDVRLHEAGSAFFKKRGMRTVVLISQQLFLDGIVGTPDGVLYDCYAEIAEYYGVDCYMIDWDTDRP